MSGAEWSEAMDTVAPRVAIVGSGPSGIYTATALLRGNASVHVDVIDRLPVPYGLVRYGVAPDHPTIKTVARVLAKPFDDERVRFIGNVEVGTDVRHEDLMASYDAVVYATGSQQDRRLGVEGEDVEGNVGSALLVGWYCGHPDAPAVELASPQVVVVGGGNVALDVARVLGRPAADLRGTDVPDEVLAALTASTVTDVHVLVRRGPAESRFSHLELLNLDELDEVDIVVHDDVRADVPADLPVGPEGDRVRRNVELFARWQQAPTTAAARRIHFHFRTKVDRLVADGGRLAAVGIAPTHGSSAAAGTIEAGLLVRAVGYIARPPAGLPFDADIGVVANRGGRVVEGAEVVAGVYVAGWCKRGSTGVIATNKTCGTQSAAAVLADLPGLTRAGRPALRLPETATDWAGWLRLDEFERSQGAGRRADRVKSADRALMVKVAAREVARA